MPAPNHLLFQQPQLLAPGDQMSRDEFLRRWNRMGDPKFAELIEGVVHVPSPLSQPHARFESLIQGVLNHYAARVRDCEPLSNATWLMTRRSAPQPDVCLRRVRDSGGRSRIENNLLAGVPELAVEICHSSRSFNLGPKRKLYQAAGVIEYLAVVLEDERLQWRHLEGGRYRLLTPHREGTLRSRVFPGLWLDMAAFWKADRALLFETVDRGLAAVR